MGAEYSVYDTDDLNTLVKQQLETEEEEISDRRC